MKSYIKWALIVWVLLCSLFNYYAFTEVLDGVIFIHLDTFAKTIGYNFSLRAPILEIFNKFIPSASVILFVINLNNDNLKQKLKKIYTATTKIQLLLLSILLPLLLFVQNHYFGQYKQLNKISNK